MTNLPFPDWVPELAPGERVLVVGASGGIGRAVVDMLLKGPQTTIGFHRASSGPLNVASDDHQIIDLPCILKTDEDCRQLVSQFVNLAGGMDSLIVLCGGQSSNQHWQDLPQDQWEADIRLNLSIPFFLARAGLEHISHGGAILLNGTESAQHGGGRKSIAYGVAKHGVECLVKGLAKEAAARQIRVNGVRLGFIDSGYHGRWQGSSHESLEKRAELVLLGRAGDVREAAAFIIFLISGWSRFITGQMLPLTGGDWL